MCGCSRRAFLGLAGAGLLAGTISPSVSAEPSGQSFIKTAFRMKAKAIASGDQPYGAVLVLKGDIIGWGPSRVVLDRNEDAHAERVAMWDAQKRLGRTDLSGALLYSTSIPCRHCQDYAARHGVSKMIHGTAIRDAGAPKRYGE